MCGSFSRSAAQGLLREQFGHTASVPSLFAEVASRPSRQRQRSSGGVNSSRQSTSRWSPQSPPRCSWPSQADAGPVPIHWWIMVGGEKESAEMCCVAILSGTIIWNATSTLMITTGAFHWRPKTNATFITPSKARTLLRDRMSCTREGLP